MDLRKEPVGDKKEYVYTYYAGIVSGPGFCAHILTRVRKDEEVIRECQNKYGGNFSGLYVETPESKDWIYLFTNPHCRLYNPEYEKEHDKHPRYIEDENGELIDTWIKVND